MKEGSGSGAGSESTPLTNGSGSRRPKNMWIRIRIRIRNTGFNVSFRLFSTNKGLNKSIGTYLRSRFSSLSHKELTWGRASELFCTIFFEELNYYRYWQWFRLKRKCLPLTKKRSPSCKVQVPGSIVDSSKNICIPRTPPVLCTVPYTKPSKHSKQRKKFVRSKSGRKFLEKLWQHWFFLRKKNSLVPGGAD